MASLRILVADDHKLVRQGVRKMIEEQPGWTVVGEAQDGRDLLEQAMATKPDAVVLDLAMPTMNGIEALRQLAAKLPDVHLLVLSMHTEEAYVLQALEAGARGYLLKDSAETDLVRAIEAVVGGQSFLSPAVAAVMLDDYVRQLQQSGSTDPYETLSEREREVFQLVAEGRNNKEVADLLCISPATVDTHRAHILKKLDLHSTAELVLFAARRGVIA
jgi:DNA-binding NarL/FixJ family response regulator